uniref:Uncharacterized protein n=1 Tax=Eutreptiella gymnastica TaxID=73025 RepID=A0A7S1N6S1_9EUGL
MPFSFTCYPQTVNPLVSPRSYFHLFLTGMAVWQHAGETGKRPYNIPPHSGTAQGTTPSNPDHSITSSSSSRNCGSGISLPSTMACPTFCRKCTHPRPSSRLCWVREDVGTGGWIGDCAGGWQGIAWGVGDWWACVGR